MPTSEFVRSIQVARGPEAKRKNLAGFLNIDGLLISLVEFTDLPVFSLNSEHTYWQNFEDTENFRTLCPQSPQGHITAHSRSCAVLYRLYCHPEGASRDEHSPLTLLYHILYTRFQSLLPRISIKSEFRCVVFSLTLVISTT